MSANGRVCIGAAVALSIAAAGSLPIQYPQEQPPRQESMSTGSGPVTASVMASWQSHGADDGPIARMPSVPLVIPGELSSGGGPNLEAQPGVARPSGLDHDRMLDLRYMRLADPVEAAIARSAAVATFVGVR